MDTKGHMKVSASVRTGRARPKVSTKSRTRRIKYKGRSHQILRSLYIVHSINGAGSFLGGVYQVDTQLCTK